MKYILIALLCFCFLAKLFGGLGSTGLGGTESTSSGGGEGTTNIPPREYYFNAASLLSLEHTGDIIPPVSAKFGSNIDILVRPFDEATNDTVSGQIITPVNVKPSGNTRFRFHWFPTVPQVATSVWKFAFVAVTNNMSWDTALTSFEFPISISVNTTNQFSYVDFTTNSAALHLTNNATLYFQLIGDGTNANDNVVGKKNLVELSIAIDQQ